MNSIRKRLLFYVLSILALGTIAVCLSTYFGIRHEMDELYDSNMRQLALTASAIPLVDLKKQRPPISDEWPRGEEVFLIQIWQKGKIEYSSHPVAGLPLQPEKGHGHVYFHDQKWGYYQEDINGHVVQVSQELHFRREVIREVYNAIIIPILIQFPVLAALVWFFVGYGFRPLSRVSDLIQKRSSTFMAPIAPEDAPIEIKTLVSALNDLLDRLKTSLDTQRRFTADAAHELRTPLTAVRLQLDLLQRAGKAKERKDALDTLERGVDRSIRLVQQLLELARQEPDHNAQAFSKLDLAEIAKNSAVEHLFLTDRKSIALDLQLKSALIKGETTGLSTLIGNLLSNAITYTSEKGHVRLKTYQAAGRSVLEISDDGIGIALEDRTRIFDRFYRVVGTGATGSGLGLSIVKNIAGRHGAEIEITEGIGGKGTGFKITFPALSVA